jgi:nucleotide-binding universal stress UspA family protein
MMSGIVVGLDGSLHARHALDWAMREAALRHAPLTVLAVNPTMASPWTGNPLTAPNQSQIEDQMEAGVRDAIAKSASEIGGAQPPSVAVTVFIGFPAQALIDASRTADLIVIGSRGAGASSTCWSAPSPARSSTTPRARWSSSRLAARAGPY